jgi:hypothetical protein
MEYQINYVAVLVTAVIYWVLGALWYSPLMFAKPWMLAIGKTEDELKQSSPVPAFVGSFVAMLVMAYVMAHIIFYSNARTFTGGLMAGFWCWLGFVATTSAINALFQRSPRALLLINNSYALLGLLIMGVIQALWR